MKLSCVGVLGPMLLGGNTIADGTVEVSAEHTLLSLSGAGVAHIMAEGAAVRRD